MNGIKNLKLVALDSNVFIYNLEQNPTYVQFTDSIFNKLIMKKLKAVTSIVSLTEVLSYPKIENKEKQIAEDFFSTPNLQVIDVGREIAIKAAKIRREYGFRLPDSVQLATAISHKADVFITNDIRLKKLKDIKVLLISEIRVI